MRTLETCRSCDKRVMLGGETLDMIGGLCADCERIKRGLALRLQERREAAAANAPRTPPPAGRWAVRLKRARTA